MSRAAYYRAMADVMRASAKAEALSPHSPPADIVRRVEDYRRLARTWDRWADDALARQPDEIPDDLGYGPGNPCPVPDGPMTKAEEAAEVHKR